MKRYYLSLALLALLASCTSENFNTESLDNEFVSHVTMTATDFELDVATRTALEITSSGLSFTWAESDEVGIYPNAGDQVSFPMTKGAGTKTANFDGGGWALRGNYTYAAYYPFSKENYDCSYTALPISYKGQKQTANNSTAELGAYDYMVATASTPESGNVTFNFQHIGSVLYLQLTSPDAATYAQLTLSADDAIFVEDATVDISNGTLTPTSTAKEITLDLENISVEAGGVLKAWMLIAPVNAVGKTLKATVTTSNAGSYTVNLSGKNFQSGKAYKLEGTLIKSNNANRPSYIGWAPLYTQIINNTQFEASTLNGTWNDSNLCNRMFGDTYPVYLWACTPDGVIIQSATDQGYPLDVQGPDTTYDGYNVYLLGSAYTDISGTSINIITATEEVLTYYIGYAKAEDLLNGNVVGNSLFAVGSSSNTITLTGEGIKKYTGCDLGDGQLASGACFFFCCLSSKTLTEWHEETNGLNDNHIVSFNEYSDGIDLGNEHYKVYYINTLRYGNITYSFRIN